MTTTTNSTTAVNPSVVNPAVTLANGVLARGDGLSGNFIFELGPTAYTYAALTTTVVGGPSTCTVKLRGSMDGVNWTDLTTSTSTTGDTQFSTGAVQFGALRVEVSNVTGAASTLAVAVGVYASSPNPAAVGISRVVITNGASNSAAVDGNSGLLTRLADPTSNTSANVSAPTGGSVTGNQALVSTGNLVAGTSFAAQTAANTLGTTVDFGYPKRSIVASFYSASTSTAGTVGIQTSMDGTHWVTSATVLTLTNLDAGSGVATANTSANSIITMSNSAFRYARAYIGTAITGGAVTALLSAS